MASGGEIRQLTGIRGIAACSVVLVHLGFDRYAAVRFFEFHDQAVDLFFCLSGFMLSLVYQAGGDHKLRLRKYFVARAARIYPLYLLMLAFCWWLTVRHLGSSGIYPEPLYMADTIRNLLMVNSWPLIGSGSNWDSPAWSLSVDAFCYVILFPILFAVSPFMSRRANSFRLALLAALGFSGFMAFALFWDVQILVARLYNAASPIAYWIPIVRGFTMFTSGWLIHGLWRTRGPIAVAAGEASSALALSVLLVLAAAWFGVVPKSCLLLLVPPLVLGLAINGGSLPSRMLASPPIHFLGEISYALYLLHEPLQEFLNGHAGFLAARPLLGFALLLLLSTVSYYTFERPMRRLINRFGA